MHRAGLEALSALAVRDPLARALQEAGLERLFREIELPLIPVLARMEADRRSPSISRHSRCSIASSTPRSPGSRRRSTRRSGTSSRSARPKQLGDILFGELQLPKGRKTKTGYSTDAAVLEELVGVHPVIQPVLDWRIYTKLRSTYVEALPTLIADDGRLHTTFHQAVASTGRLSSSDPNLQNIPIRTPLGRRIRRAFVAGSPGHRPGRRRLLADRAADHRPRVRRRAPQGGVRAPGGHPSRDGGPRARRSRQRTSRRTSARWPRWSTSGWRTG